MTRGRILIVLVVVAVPAAFFATHRVCNQADCDELTWLQEEFRLTSTQVEQVAAIQRSYQGVCADHCDEISRARQHITLLVRDGRRGTPEYTEAMSVWRQKTGNCNESTKAHIHAIAAVMTPEQSQRYLTLVTPLLEEQANAGPQAP